MKFFEIEIIIIVVFIIFQIWSFVNSCIKLHKFKLIFEDKLTIIKGKFDKTRFNTSTNIIHEVKNNSNQNLEYFDAKGQVLDDIDCDNLIKLSLVDCDNENESIERIKNTLNSYLINNYGAAVNFSIIKDIVDREVDVKDEAIAQSLPVPLYLGLAGTMVGIILGLFSMPSINGDGFTTGINSLIDGVKIAMIASLAGLILTTILSTIIYKNAKKKVLIDKNDQLSFLQAELLPELVKAEDTGVSGLKASLDRFAREATSISTNVLSAANKTNENLQKQNEVIDKIEKLNMTKVSRANLELFDRIESNFVMLNKFNGYISALQNISENLVEFSKRSSDVEIIASEIKENMINSNAIMKLLKTHSEALTAHIEQIKDSGGAACSAVDSADSAFSEAIEKLQTEINVRMLSLSKSADSLDVNLQTHFENIGSNLIETTSRHLDELSSVYEGSVPKFEQLDNLILLPEIKEDTTRQSQELLNAINQLNRSLGLISNQMSNQTVISKLEAIEKSINRRRIPYSVHPTSKKKENIFRKIFNVKSKNKKNLE